MKKLKGIFVEFDPVNKNPTNYYNYYIPKCKKCGEHDFNCWEKDRLCKKCQTKKNRKEKLEKIKKSTKN